MRSSPRPLTRRTEERPSDSKEWGDNTGAFLGPLLAVLFLTVWHLDMRLIFYLALVPGLLAFLMIRFVEERPVDAKAKVKIDVSLRRFPKAYWKYLLATALFGLGNSSNAFLILQTQDIGASLTATILTYAGFNLVAALISYPAGYLSDRLGRRNVIVVVLVIFLIAYGGFALSRSIALIAVFFAFYGLYQGIFRSVGKALASDYVPERLRASGIGWYNTTVGLCGLVASLSAGWLWDHVGHAAVFLVGAGFAVVGGVALLAFVPADLKKKES